jgi:hypothetical protein
MEASMHGYGTECAADAAGVRAYRAPRIQRSGGEVRASARRADRPDRRPTTARLEHALFALVLGCVGCVWLGALLAEATQAL